MGERMNFSICLAQGALFSVSIFIRGGSRSYLQLSILICIISVTKSTLGNSSSIFNKYYRRSCIIIYSSCASDTGVS